MAVFTIPAGVTSRPHFVPAGSIVKVSPAAGALAIVEYTRGSAVEIANGVATWAPWLKGTVTAETSDCSNNPISVRLTAVGDAAVLDIDPTPSAAKLTAFRSDWGGALAATVGALTSGVWTAVPSIFRLRLTGTGTCVVDSRNRLGTVSTAIASFSPSGATNQIEYPYPGDDAVEIRATLTGTCKAEVI